MKRAQLFPSELSRQRPPMSRKRFPKMMGNAAGFVRRVDAFKSTARTDPRLAGRLRPALEPARQAVALPPCRQHLMNEAGTEEGDQPPTDGQDLDEQPCIATVVVDA